MQLLHCHAWREREREREISIISIIPIKTLTAKRHDSGLTFISTLDHNHLIKLIIVVNTRPEVSSSNSINTIDITFIHNALCLYGFLVNTSIRTAK